MTGEREREREGGGGWRWGEREGGGREIGQVPLVLVASCGNETLSGPLLGVSFD